MEYIVTEKMRQWGKANGFNVDIHAEFFNDYLANKTGKPYKDLDAAFRNCVRCDWGGLRKQMTKWQPPEQKVVVRDTFIPLPPVDQCVQGNPLRSVK